MNGVADMFNRYTLTEDQAVIKIWWLSRFLGVDTNESQIFPKCLQQIIQVEVHVAADYD